LIIDPRKEHELLTKDPKAKIQLSISVYIARIALLINDLLKGEFLPNGRGLVLEGRERVS
jgi:hypothetical protein